MRNGPDWEGIYKWQDRHSVRKLGERRMKFGAAAAVPGIVLLLVGSGATWITGIAWALIALGVVVFIIGAITRLTAGPNDFA